MSLLQNDELIDKVIEVANRVGCDVNGFDIKEDAYNKMFLFLFKQFEASLKEKQQPK